MLASKAYPANWYKSKKIVPLSQTLFSFSLSFSIILCVIERELIKRTRERTYPNICIEMRGDRKKKKQIS